VWGWSGGNEAVLASQGAQGDRTAARALTYLEECEAAGDFIDFSPKEYLERYKHYFNLE
jgi:hypothetical protein